MPRATRKLQQAAQCKPRPFRPVHVDPFYGTKKIESTAAQAAVFSGGRAGEEEVGGVDHDVLVHHALQDVLGRVPFKVAVQ